MKNVITRYGKLNGLVSEEYFENGNLKSARLSEYSQLTIGENIFVPNYLPPTYRKKYREAVRFFEDGSIRSIYLEEQQTITGISMPDSQTEVSIGGEIPAELITFYPNGNYNRIFPLYGQVSAYWSDENEYALAGEIKITILGQTLLLKPQIIHFYPSGNLRSITLWKQERLTLETPYGPITTNLGFELYETGELKSIEPVYGTIIQKNGESVHCFHYNPLKFHADNNSLKF